MKLKMLTLTCAVCALCAIAGLAAATAPSSASTSSNYDMQSMTEVAAPTQAPQASGFYQVTPVTDPEVSNAAQASWSIYE